MTFSEWCNKELGITDFMEGKIPNSIFLPAFSGRRILTGKIIENEGGYVIDTPYLRGLIIPVDRFIVIQSRLYQKYSKHAQNYYIPFGQWQNEYFFRLGIDLSDQKEYKEPSNIHLTFASAVMRQEFLTEFSYLQPIPSFNPISRKYTLEVPAHSIQLLRQLYYQSPEARVINEQGATKLTKQINELNKLKNLIINRQMSTRLDLANILSRDYTNSAKPGKGLCYYQAASAYSLSLKVYAEINHDNLSTTEYRNLNTLASLLASYNESGHLEQSLKTDAFFADNLTKKFLDPYTKLTNGKLNIPILAKLPQTVQNALNKHIQQNITDILYGNEQIPLGKGAYYRSLRFLPDAGNRGETDMIICQGGEMRNHSALFRIIKIGILANGKLAARSQQAHHYQYYKVVDNLGDNCQGVDPVNKTCFGTFVTHLIPMQMKNEIYLPIQIDPFKEPNKYQLAMEFTLKKMIETERHLLFYRKPAIHPDTLYSEFGSSEGLEWTRLTYLNHVLSGVPVFGNIPYFITDPLDATQHYLAFVAPQRNYYQEGGSCVIFALKSLASSLLGTYANTLHINFMQLNGAQGHLDAIRQKVMQLEKRLVQYRSLNKEPIVYQSQRLFFNPSNTALEKLKNSPLTGAHSIISIKVLTDASQNHILIDNINIEQAALLAQSIDSIVLANPKTMVIGRSLILSEEKMLSLCQIFEINYESLMRSAPTATNQMAMLI